ncbi:uncharacterized protein LOC110117161 [Athalia rosae]|uniref:uncharacterized protein LOC110117161 n=1 Tax=Athalia rosae TaxID=37344 RepID=UPI0020332F58|nr:uncharacterized protein LOC110117161 [Athalia rosae]
MTRGKKGDEDEREEGERGGGGACLNFDDHCVTEPNQDINESLQRSTPLHPDDDQMMDLQHMRRTTPSFCGGRISSDVIDPLDFPCSSGGVQGPVPWDCAASHRPRGPRGPSPRGHVFGDTNHSIRTQGPLSRTSEHHD